MLDYRLLGVVTLLMVLSVVFYYTAKEDKGMPICIATGFIGLFVMLFAVLVKLNTIIDKLTILTQ